MATSLFDRPTQSDTTVSGTVERISHRTSSGWCVIQVSTGGSVIPATGVLPPSVGEGDYATLDGAWGNNKWGVREFKFSTARPSHPTDSEGRIRYMAAVLPSVGPKRARALDEAFGADVFDALGDAERLCAVDGISIKTAAEIVGKWIEVRSARDVDQVFAMCGLTSANERRILAKYCTLSDYPRVQDVPIEIRRRAANELQANPYSLIETCYGIGFMTADKLAHRFGVTRNAPSRIEAAILHIVSSEADSGGHVWTPESDARRKVMDLLEKCDGYCAITDDDFDDAMLQLEMSGRITHESGGIAMAWLDDHEAYCARSIAALASHPVDAMEIDWGKPEFSWLTVEQRDALATLANARVGVLTGGPGTGKTTIIKAYIAAMESAGIEDDGGRRDATIELAAPTGKAAKRLSQQTQRDARTIHRLLEYNPEFGFGRNETFKLSCDIVIVDESSMIDVSLLKALLAAVDEKKTRVLFVGDVDQIPSVGPGQTLHDMIASGRVAVCRLTKIMRQREHSAIVATAHSVNSGRGIVEGDDLLWRKTTDGESIADVVVSHVSGLTDTYGLDSIQVLTPMKTGPGGSEKLNDAMSEAFNPNGVRIGKSSMKVGDRVLHRVNSYSRFVYPKHAEHDREFQQMLDRCYGEDADDRKQARASLQVRYAPTSGVFNGELGRIVSRHNGYVLVRYDDGGVSDYAMSDLFEETIRAWCMTIHKSQGSEFPATIVVLDTSQYVMLKRNLAYTAITRAMSSCILVASPRAVSIAVRTNDALRRRTKLVKRIRECQ